MCRSARARDLRESGQRLRRDPAGLAGINLRAASIFPTMRRRRRGDRRVRTEHVRIRKGGERRLWNRVVDRAFGDQTTSISRRGARFRDLSDADSGLSSVTRSPSR